MSYVFALLVASCWIMAGFGQDGQDFYAGSYDSQGYDMGGADQYNSQYAPQP